MNGILTQNRTICVSKFPSRFTGVAAAFGLMMFSSVANASETAFIFNTFSFILWGVLVMWMCAGFTMLEAGSVRTKNASVICLKNIGLYAIAGLAYYTIGYNLMYVDVGDFFGTFTLFYSSTESELALLAGNADALESVLESYYSTMSDWFFQMVFVATTASIVSGALAERVKLWSFFIFTIFLTALIYPIIGAWTWGGGWLNEMGFQDFAGSTIVHSTGGWAALAGAIVVGARLNKFRKDGTVKNTPPSKCSRSYARSVHIVVGLVRFQRRLPACNGLCSQCGCNEHRAREYQPGSSGGRNGGSFRVSSFAGSS